ncbi:MAG TPA: isoprenylcysteine carboxylmethyltransferase family protein [Candidatus Angelobacter sp.]|nr:isoprenylcysteine carboxylmethyltransferase family protein [Candidatus Angelobacter sp.]
MVQRIAAVIYGIVCYLVFFATFLYAIAFVGNIRVPRSVDVGPGAPATEAFIIDALLLALFAVQHSVMARHWFKRAWTRIVPQVIERSTYVLFASLALILMYWQWRPMTGTVWSVQSGVPATLLWVACGAGWATVLATTFLISHFDLFGLKQVYAYFAGKSYPAPKFTTPLFYKLVRHPLYLGFTVAFWATPHMTVGHLFFAFMCTSYMIVAIQFEERDLVRTYGASYETYRKSVSMLIPMRPKEMAPKASSAGQSKN